VLCLREKKEFVIDGCSLGGCCSVMIYDEQRYPTVLLVLCVSLEFGNLQGGDGGREGISIAQIAVNAVQFLRVLQSHVA